MLFDTIKSLHKHKFNNKGLISTRFLLRKRKMLNIHRQIQKTVLFILCIGEINLNLRQEPLEQMYHSNLNIAYTYDQLRKSNIKGVSCVQSCAQL